MRALIEPIYRKLTDGLSQCGAFRSLRSGSAGREDYDRFICALFAIHVTAPRYFAFLYALAPPTVEPVMRRRLLARLGQGMPDGEAQPLLLRRMLLAADLGDKEEGLQQAALARLAPHVREPAKAPTLALLGLNAYVSVLAFEYLLHHCGDAMAEMLRRHRGLSPADLVWFEVQKEGTRELDEIFALLARYVEFYAIADGDAARMAAAALPDGYLREAYFPGAG
jgi:hypothetical protein